MVEEILAKIYESVVDGDSDLAEELVKEAVDKGVDPLEIINKGLIKGAREVGDAFTKREIFLTELAMAGDALTNAIEILRPIISASGNKIESRGKYLIGTVKDDIHDIGKNIVSALLMAEGFEVIDIGIDVSKETFKENILKHSPDIVGMSVLMTITMPRLEETIEYLKSEGVRDRVKIMIGGAPVTESWVKQVGGDGYSGDAVSAVKVTERLIAESVETEKE